MIMGITELGEGRTDECGRREIVSFRAKRALVGAGARILFYPTLVYNVLRNKIQAEFRWWDEIDQFLLLGAVPFPNDVPRLKKLGVRGVITLNEPYETLVPSNIYKVHGIDHLVIPTRDYLFAPTPVDICRAVDFIHRNASHGRTTYVHCKAGRGRSATIVLCYLIEYKNMTPMAALEYVRSRRPRVLLAPSQWQAVEAYNKNKLEFPAIRSPKPKHLHTADVGTISLMDSPRSPLKEEYLITEEDLEGYEKFLDVYEDTTLCPFEEDGILITDTDLEGCETFVDALDESNTSCFSDDEILITEADLEGYETSVDGCNQNSISSDQINQTLPVMRRLSCFFASIKLSNSDLPVSSRHSHIHIVSS
ncbi:phosphatidylglycerophosphate phosphatase PTPMT2-like [Zingiber officinale]|nr:phosphatidylglycerophosphate phosphatase PTPMT2-like [Zingiber officinale]XP_042411637.1 phosphatidylglycerophosphate phosphatase PTPMT2-like [Zingiber officinale]